MRKPMIATRSFRYGTRMLQAGEDVDMRRQDARLFGALRWAREPEQRAKPQAEPADDGDTDALRAEAESLGVEVDGRWKAKRLRSEIAKAKGEKG